MKFEWRESSKRPPGISVSRRDIKSPSNAEPYDSNEPWPLTPDDRPLRESLLPADVLQSPRSGRVTLPHQGRRTALIGSVLNLVSGIMGSGMLVLPYIVAKCGILVFTILLAVVACVTQYSLVLLLDCARATREASYEDLGFRAFGPAGRRAVVVVILLQSFGNITTYMCVIRVTRF